MLSTRIWSWLLMGVMLVSLGQALPGMAAAQEKTVLTEEEQEALVKIRQAMAARDVALVSESLQEAKGMAAKSNAGPESFSEQLTRLSDLANYQGQFWDAVDSALKGLENESELELADGSLASVVEVMGQNLVMRIAGKNRTYTKKTMPGGLALLLAKRVLPLNVPANQVVIGSFLAMDAEGDQELARKYWQEAIDAKADVAYLLPELDIMPPLPAIELPKLTPLMKNLLNPKTNWLLRYTKPAGDKPTKGAAGNYTKGAIEKVAKTSGDDRLLIAVADDAASPAQVYFKKPLTGNFVCRLTLAEVGEGQTLAFLASDREGEGWRKSLPQGTFQVEISRSAGKLSIRLAGKTVKPPALGNAAFAGPVLLILEVPPGGSCTVASVEFGSK